MNKIITALLILLTVSCQNEQKSKKIITNTEKPVSINKNTDTIETSTTNTTLNDTNETEVLDDSLSVVKNKIFENFEYLQKTSFFNEYEISLILLVGRHSDSLEVNDINFTGYYLMKLLDRTPQNIKNFFGEKEIEILAKIIIDNNNYVNSRTNLWLDGFIQSYKELKNDPEFLKQASNEKDSNTYYELLSSKYSAEASRIMDFESIYDLDYKLFKIYSFWVRRYDEENSEAVFSVIKKFKDQFSSKIEKGDINAKKNALESKILNDNFSAFDFDENILNYIISELNIPNTYFERFIAENSISASSDYSNNAMTKLNTIYSDFDRTPENIDKVFNTNLIDHIAFLFNNDFLIKDQKLYDVLKGLLLTYDEMNDSECERLHHIMSEYKFHDMRDEFIKKCSDTVRQFVYDGGDFKASTLNGSESDRDYGYGKRIFYLYSFWVRRYREGNKETVYNILKEMDKKIK